MIVSQENLTKKLMVSQEILIKTLIQQKQPRISWRADNMRKAAVVTLILIGLMTIGMVCVQPIRAEYQGNIALNADGNVTPSTAPIQQTGDTYTLTGDVVGSISVLRSNTTFDGNGHSLTGGRGVGGLSVGYDFYSSTSSVGASNVTVKNLIVKGSVYGIALIETKNALVFNNTVSGTSNVPFQPTAGIRVEGGGSNIIKGNNLVKNQVGMSFLGTKNNLIVENNIENCSTSETGGYGIMFWTGASNNTIYHNNFINNRVQAYNSVNSLPINTWDNGYPSGGNYWSDYKTKYPSAAEIGDSKIGNRAYAIDSKNRDRYPLMEPFTATLPQITLLSPVNQVYNESSVDLVFTTDEAANWTGYSLDGEQNVTVTGNTTIADLPNGSHTLAVYANDTLGNMGTSETVFFTVKEPEQEPFPTATVAAVSGMSALIVFGAVLAIYFKKRKL
jgi:parallel beta-helix repeat protein